MFEKIDPKYVKELLDAGLIEEDKDDPDNKDGNIVLKVSEKGKQYYKEHLVQ